MDLQNLKSRDLVVLSCSVCKQTFTRTVRDLKRYAGRNFKTYCSNKCQTESHKITINCLNCNNVLITNKKQNRKFCSQSCAASFNNKKRELLPDKNCKQCQKPCKYRKSDYCSNSCHQRKIHEDWIERWLAGKETGVRSSGLATSNRIKKWLIETFGDKCSICGWSKVHPVTKKVPVQLDHKDGHSENNSPENVRLLCPSCHSLTPTFGNLNKGNGRKNRRNIALVV